MISITDYISGVFFDFRKSIDSNIELCSLKSVNFNKSYLPDYSNCLEAEYYLLRYAFAYCFEYKHIFEILLPKHKILGDPTINVLSIGCGAYLDYFGIVQAVESKGLKSKIKYDGIDLIDWAHKIEQRKEDTVSFFQKDICTFLSETKKIDCNFIVFPKSIGELDDDTFYQMCTSIRKIKFTSETIRLIVSLRDSLNNLKKDLSRTNEIIAAFNANSNDSFAFPNYEKNKCVSLKDIAIISLDSNYKYPDEVLNYITDLSKKCRQYRANGKSCAKCSTEINRLPILKAKYLKYKVVEISKKQR